MDNSHTEKDSNTDGDSFEVKKGMEAFVQLKDLIESESLSAQLILRVLLSSNVSDEIKIAYLESFSENERLMDVRAIGSRDKWFSVLLQIINSTSYRGMGFHAAQVLRSINYDGQYNDKLKSLYKSSPNKNLIIAIEDEEILLDLFNESNGIDNQIKIVEQLDYRDAIREDEANMIMAKTNSDIIRVKTLAAFSRNNAGFDDWSGILKKAEAYTIEDDGIVRNGKSFVYVGIAKSAKEGKKVYFY